MKEDRNFVTKQLELCARQMETLTLLHKTNKKDAQAFFKEEGELLKKISKLQEIDEALRKTEPYADLNKLFPKWLLWGASGLFTLYVNLQTLKREGMVVLTAFFKWENGFGDLLGLIALLWPIISVVYIISNTRLYLKNKEKRKQLLFELKNLE